MGYPPRDQTPGYHHVTCRGNNKRITFRDDSDRRWFLERLNRIARRHDWSVLAYALMRTHYHLVLRSGPAGLAGGMCQLNTAYAQRLNRQEGRINHVFGRRYWSERLHDDRRLLTTLRYVVRNPARAGAEGSITTHTWTSYPATLGRAATPVRIPREELFALFDLRPLVGATQFRAFCEADDGPPGP